MRILTSTAMGILSTLSFGGVAHAEVTQWSSPASACTPTLGQDVLEVNQAKVGFKSGKTGAIILICPVTDARGPIRAMFTLTQDSTGTGTGAVATAQFVKTSVSTGISSTIGSTMNSNAFNATTLVNRLTVVSQTMMTLDFEQNVYHVQLVLKRSSSDQSVSFTTIQLKDGPVPN
jgi:hypothetical protein